MLWIEKGLDYAKRMANAKYDWKRRYVITMEGHKLCTLICAFADRKIFVNCVTLDHVVLCFFMFGPLNE